MCGKLHYVILHFLPANKSTNQGNQRIWMELYDTTRPVKVFSFRPKVVVRCSLKLPVLDILCNCCFWRCSKPQPTGAKSGREMKPSLTKDSSKGSQGVKTGAANKQCFILYMSTPNPGTETMTLKNKRCRSNTSKPKHC